MASNLPDPQDIPDMTLQERSQTPSTPGPKSEITSPQSKKSPAPWDKPTTAGGWKVGDRVLAPWEPMFCYVGTIQEINKLKVMIQFDDGDFLSRPARKFRAGKMGALFYPGEIGKIRGDEVLVVFEDGSEEWTRIAALRFFREEDDDTQGAQPTKVESHKVFLDGLRKGHRVWAPWQAGVLFVGTVHDLRDDKAHIHFDDGDQGWAQLDHLLPFEPTPGMRVMGNWRMGGAYFPGVVTKVAGERLYIHYDDGDEEWTTPRALAMPGNPEASAEPTKTVAHAASNPRRWLFLVGIAIVAFMLFWRFGCRG